MHPAEGFSCIFTVTQQHDIERFIRYIAPALDAPQSWSRGERPPTAAQHKHSQQQRTAQHMSSQPQAQDRQPERWQPLPPHLHASSTRQHAGDGSHGIGQHARGTPVPLAGSASWTADICAAHQPSGSGRQQGRAAPDNDSRAVPQKEQKKKQKNGARSLSSFEHARAEAPLPARRSPSSKTLPTADFQPCMLSQYTQSLCCRWTVT